jgi:hypothetical protein
MIFTTNINKMKFSYYLRTSGHFQFDNFDSAVNHLIQELLNIGSNFVSMIDEYYIVEFKEGVYNQRFNVRFNETANHWDIINHIGIPINPFWMEREYFQLIVMLNNLITCSAKCNVSCSRPHDRTPQSTVNRDTDCTTGCRKPTVIASTRKPIVAPIPQSKSEPKITSEMLTRMQEENYELKRAKFEEAKSNRTTNTKPTPLKNNPETDRRNDELREERKEVQRVEERKRVFLTDKKVYQLCKDDLASGELQWERFPVIFASKYLILKLLEDRNQIDFTNNDAVEREFELFDAIMKQMEPHRPKRAVSIPHNYNYMTAEQKNEYAIQFDMTVEELEKLQIEEANLDSDSDLDIDIKVDIHGEDDELDTLDTQDTIIQHSNVVEI